VDAYSLRLALRSPMSRRHRFNVHAGKGKERLASVIPWLWTSLIGLPAIYYKNLKYQPQPIRARPARAYTYRCANQPKKV